MGERKGRKERNEKGGKRGGGAGRKGKGLFSLSHHTVNRAQASACRNPRRAGVKAKL